MRMLHRAVVTGPDSPSPPHGKLQARVQLSSRLDNL